jgi:hypothetical protein
VIRLDDWAKIRHLFSTGEHSKREIARLVGASRGTVDRALAEDRHPVYQRAPSGLSFDAFVSEVRSLLAAAPTMPAAAIAERVGCAGSPSLFRAKIAGIRPDYVAPDPADRIAPAGVPGPVRPVVPARRSPARRRPAGFASGAGDDVDLFRVHPGQNAAIADDSGLLGGRWSLIEGAGAVPARLTRDDETGIGRGKLTDSAAVFAGTQIKLLKARDPESKGGVFSNGRTGPFQSALTAMWRGGRRESDQANPSSVLPGARLSYRWQRPSADSRLVTL